MEAHQEEEGAGGFGGRMTARKHRNKRLTENEAVGAVVVEDGGLPKTMFISTKRPDDFPVGAMFRFMNKWQNYGWTVDRHEELDGKRTHVVMKDPKKIYRHVFRPVVPA